MAKEKRICYNFHMGVFRCIRQTCGVSPTEHLGVSVNHMNKYETTVTNVIGALKTDYGVERHPFFREQFIYDVSSQYLGCKLYKPECPERVMSLNLAPEAFNASGDKLSEAAGEYILEHIRDFWRGNSDERHRLCEFPERR